MNVSRRRLLSWLPAVAAIPAIPALARLKPSVEKPVAPPEVKVGEYLGRDLSRTEFDWGNGTMRVYNKQGKLCVTMGRLDTRV